MAELMERGPQAGRVVSPVGLSENGVKFVNKYLKCIM